MASPAPPPSVTAPVGWSPLQTLDAATAPEGVSLLPEQWTDTNAARRATETTTCFYKGYKYTQSYISTRKASFRCSIRRSTKCLGAMEVVRGTMGCKIIRPHTCRDLHVFAPVENVEMAMKAVVDSMAMADLTRSVASIWTAVSEQFYGPEGQNLVRGLGQDHVESRVRRVRRKAYGTEVYGMIERPPASLVRGGTLPFFHYHQVTTNDDPLKPPNRVIVWAHPLLMERLCNHNVTIFIDGTFRCVPRHFAQCVVIMVHDRASHLFIPVFYVLTTNRTEDTYWDVLHYASLATEQQLNPAEVVCDFEVGLMSAIQTQFPSTDVIGCLFHFKQAIRRKMTKLGISTAEVTVAMSRGVLDMLTVIDPAKVETHGIPWVKQPT